MLRKNSFNRTKGFILEDGLDGSSYFLQFLLLIFLIGLNAFFASSEVALISLKPAVVRKLAEASAKGRKLAALLENSGRFLATVQVGVTMAGFMASAFAAESFAEPITRKLLSWGVSIHHSTLEAVVVIVITSFLAYISLVFGELVPKQLALKYAEPIGLNVAGVIDLFARIASPFVWVLNSSVNCILRLFGIEAQKEEEVTEEEIRMMVDIGAENGTIETDEQKMIENIFEFTDTTAAEVMTPRTEVIAIAMDAEPEEIERVLMECGFSRVPVYEESVDNIIGQLHFREYFTAKINGNAAPDIRELITPVFLAPETMRANLLFRNMQSKKFGMAVILDEFGGTSGIVTMEDLLEEIVGSIYDEFDDGNDEAESLGGNVWRVNGTMRIDEVTRMLDISDETLPEEATQYDTVGGLIFGLLNEVPTEGAKVELPEAGLFFEVESVDERRVEKAKISYVPIEKPEFEEE